MRRLLLIIAIALVLAAVCAPADQSSGAVCDDVRVFVLDEDGGYTESTVSGVQTVKGAVEAAMEDQGRSMELNMTKTSILSVDGRRAPADSYWRVFQWLPAGTSGWGVQAFNAYSDGRMASGTAYCVTLSEIRNENGTNVYSVPEFEPVSTGYVFIRFANGFSPDNEHVQKVFTPEIRESGFWIEGRGSNMGDVLKDAIESNWPGEIETFTGDADGVDVAEWISVLFGLGNERAGDNAWAYWSQWSWADHEWRYNDWTLGYYDPAVHPYLECVYLISTPDPYSGEYVIDKGGPEPDPDRDEIRCMKNVLTAEFRLDDGTLWDTMKAMYGERVDASGVRDPSVQGKGFVGWGDTTAPMTEDAVFTASFVDLAPGMVRVRYLDDRGALIVNEYLAPGAPASYDGVPSKPSTREQDFVFSGWDADLSSVAADVAVGPVFEPVPRKYEARFFDYDRSPIATAEAAYGSYAQAPPDPQREPTARYQYSFAGWSATPNGYVPVELGPVEGPIYAYAYYEPEARPYTLTFVEDGEAVCERQARYGSPIGGALPAEVFGGAALAKMYSDPGLTRECPVNHIVVGDTTIYVSRVAGSYEVPLDAGGGMAGDTVSVSFTPDLARQAAVEGGAVVVCDLSQYPSGTAASVDRESLSALASARGAGSEAVMIVPRGSISMPLSSMLDVVGDGDSLLFSVQNGPLNVKISTALKKVNYSGFYRLNLRVDGAPVTDLEPLGASAAASLLLELDEGMHADVWNISPNGAVTHLEPSYDGQFATFRTSLMQFYAVGTTDTASVRQTVVCPYGECEYTVEGSGTRALSTLASMSLDNMGGTLFVPSCFGGGTLSRIEAGALNGVVDAPAVVVPVTVDSFSWASWSNAGIRDVYFLGDAPVFDGAPPEGLAVHHPEGDGWDVGESDLEFHTYNGSYRKDVFSFVYYVVGDSAVVHRYLGGPYVQIPESVSVGGTAYPVAYIGDSAFMDSQDRRVRERQMLVNEAPCMLETVELGPHVRGILTGAFEGSTISSLYSAGSVAHVWDRAFRGCHSLSNVSFSDGLVFVGEEAFESCDGRAFTRFDAPATLREMGRGAFYGCSSLSTVTLGEGLGAVPEECFGHCVGLTDMELPQSVASVGDRAFYGCSGLQYVDLKGVSEVGKDAFYSPYGASAMEFAVFGESLRSLGPGAFGNCSRISELEVHCELFPSFEGAFTDVDVDAISVYASDGVIGSWSGYGAEPIDEPEVKKDDSLLLSVEAGMIVFFAALGAAAFYRKSRA